MDDPVDLLLSGRAGQAAGPLSNTTIGVVATDAALNKEGANYLAGVSHDGLALTIRPCHTERDGDTMFALATGSTAKNGPMMADLTLLGAAAVEVTARAVINALRSATSLGGLPSIADMNAETSD
jgi:L-aminopeptidase/D-esterase-like protein